MNLRQMQYFVAIAEDGSISRSAERLLVAQPSLSQQIKSLEAEVGGALFERIPKGVRLTAAGKAFLPEARAAITHAANATRNARSVLGLDGGELEVATITSVAFGILPSAFQAWHEHHPASTIALREYTDRNALAEAVPDSRGMRACGLRPTSDGADNSSRRGEPPCSRRTRSDAHTRERGARRPARGDLTRQAPVDPKAICLYPIRMAAIGNHFRRSAAAPALAHQTGQGDRYPVAGRLAEEAW
jgi:DNA-binding transcriptional LysR family regulator